MDVLKMQGLIQAIEAEHKQPNPNHGNLARLTAAALTEIMDFLNKLSSAVLPILAVNQYRGLAKSGEVPESNQTTLGLAGQELGAPIIDEAINEATSDQAEAGQDQAPKTEETAPETAPAA